MYLKFVDKSSFSVTQSLMLKITIKMGIHKTEENFKNWR